MTWVARQIADCRIGYRQRSEGADWVCLFTQNKANLPHFGAGNEDRWRKRSQTKPIRGGAGLAAECGGRQGRRGRCSVPLVMQNKANFPRFWPGNGDQAKNQSQSKPIWTCWMRVGRLGVLLVGACGRFGYDVTRCRGSAERWDSR